LIVIVEKKADDRLVIQSQSVVYSVLVHVVFAVETKKNVAGSD
jgi:hypothetical protein